MSRSLTSKLVVALGLVVLGTCGGSKKDDGPAVVVDAGADTAPLPDATSDGVPGDATADTPPSPFAFTLERPTDLPRPPIGRLPADLLPPQR